MLLRTVLDAWAGLAAAAWPWTALTAVLAWAALATRTIQASPKSYTSEQRIGALETGYLPAAVQPGSSPPVLETWHDFPAGVAGWGNGTGGWKKYRLLAEGSVEVSISLRQAGTKTDSTGILAAGALPAGYAPVTSRRLLPAVTNGSALSPNWSPNLSFNTDGSVSVFGMNNGTSTLVSVDCHGVYSTF